MAIVDLQRQVREQQAKIEELRGDILRERGQRHALQQELAQSAREDTRQWNELQKLLGALETKVEILMRKIQT